MQHALTASNPLVRLVLALETISLLFDHQSGRPEDVPRTSMQKIPHQAVLVSHGEVARIPLYGPSR